MAAKAYLTIDDSPSKRMNDFVDALEERNIPALFFCRGDKLEENPLAAIRAVERGFILGNHTYSHIRAADSSYEEIVAEIEKTERMIDNIYNFANMPKPGQYFRFPHLDRGCGSWIVDYELIDMKFRNQVKAIFTEGLNVISAAAPSSEKVEKKKKLQEFLKTSGYTAPFSKVNLDWWKTPEIKEAHDCLFTFSSSDWMITMRHLGKWRYKSLEDLQDKIANDKWLLAENNVGVVLVHDQLETIDTAMVLIDHMMRCKISFIKPE